MAEAEGFAPPRIARRPARSPASAGALRGAPSSVARSAPSARSRSAPAAERPPDHGARLHPVALVRLEAVHAGSQQGVDRRRQREQRRAHGGQAGFACARAGAPRRACARARRRTVDCPPARTATRCARSAAMSSSPSRCSTTRLLSSPSSGPSGSRCSVATEVGPDVEQVASRKRDDQDRRAVERSGQVLDEVEQDRLGPVDVLEDEDQRALRRGVEQLPHRPERRSGVAGASDQPSAPATRSTTASASSSPSTRRASLDLRPRACSRRRGCRSTLPRPRASGQNVSPSPYDGNGRPRPRARPPTDSVNSCASRDLPMPAGPRIVTQLAAAPVDCARSKRRGELPQLALAPDEGGGEPPSPSAGASSMPTSLNAGTRPRLALQLQRRERLHADRVPDKLERALADQDLAARRPPARGGPRR